MSNLMVRLVMFILIVVALLTRAMTSQMRNYRSILERLPGCDQATNAEWPADVPADGLFELKRYIQEWV